MICAIDPGKNGALSYLQNGEVEAFNMPETEGDIVKLFMDTIGRKEPMDTIEIFMEKLTGFCGGSGNPGSAMFTLAKYYWCWIFLAIAFDVRINLVTPQKWQKFLDFGTKGSVRGKTTKEKYVINRDWKNKLKGEAQRLYPAIKVTLDNCDSLLILEYARRITFHEEAKSLF